MNCPGEPILRAWIDGYLKKGVPAQSHHKGLDYDSWTNGNLSKWVPIARICPSRAFFLFFLDLSASC